MLWVTQVDHGAVVDLQSNGGGATCGGGFAPDPQLSTGTFAEATGFCRYPRGLAFGVGLLHPSRRAILAGVYHSRLPDQAPP